MMKFTARLGKGGFLLGLGLTAENVKRLKSGQPIHVFCQDVHLPWQGEILIMYGETEAAMVDELSANMGPGTIVHDIRGKGSDA